MLWMSVCSLSPGGKMERMYQIGYFPDPKLLICKGHNIALVLYFLEG